MSTESPSVLVLLVTSNAELWLPDVIESVRNQTFDDLEVLAIDNASTDRSRRLVDKAFGQANVIGLERRVGYGRALAAGLKVAAERGSTATAFLLLHDDAAMDPGSVEAMMLALERERVGIVGAKLVEWDFPERLLEVGLTTDHFGRIFNPLERGELDQGQHDGLKEVFYSSSACLLVSRDVVEKVGLFDLRYAMLRDDFDLCWRARIAGYRAVVTTQARVRHVAATTNAVREAPAAGRARYFSDRNLFASLIKNYSLPRMLYTLPASLGISLVNAILFAFTGRRNAAKQTLSALQWNLVHLPSTLRARARSQRRRRVPDRDVVKLMVRGAPRVRTYVERAFEQIVGEPAEGLDEDDDGTIARIEAERGGGGRFIRNHPVGLVLAIFALLYLIGARRLFGTGGLAGADFAPFPGRPGDFFTAFFSGWRAGGTGAAAPASPALFLEGILSLLTFGSAHIAERLFVLSLIPLAAASASSLAGAVGLPLRARWTAAIAYGLSPLALAAFSQGRIPDLVVVTALPVLLLPALRAGGFAPKVGWRSLATGVIGLAVVASIAPYALVAVAGAGVIVALCAVVAGAGERAPRVAAAAIVQAAGATLVLLPWSIELFKSGSLIGSRPGPYGVPLTSLLHLSAGGRSPIPTVFAWAFPAAGAAGVLLAIATRDTLVKMFAIVATIGLGLAWAVSRGVPWIAPRPALPLTLAALGIALLAALAAEGIVPALQQRSFGALHLVSVTLAAFAFVAAVTGGAFLTRGNLHGLATSGELVPAFFASEAKQLGDFRILWLGGSPRALHADITGSQGETATTYLDRRAGAGQRYLETALASILTRQTEQGGRLLAPLGIRYVVLRTADRDIARLFVRQVDLAFSQRFKGAEILGNDAWLPIAAGVSSPRWIAASLSAPKDALVAAASAPLDPGRSGVVREVRPGRFEGTVGADARAILLAEPFGTPWRADTAHGRISGLPSFGWATGFPLPPGGGPIVVTWNGQGWQRLALLAELAILVAIAAAWSRRAAMERGER